MTNEAAEVGRCQTRTFSRVILRSWGCNLWLVGSHCRVIMRGSTRSDLWFGESVKGGFEGGRQKDGNGYRWS